MPHAGWLGDELADQSGRGLGPHTTKDLIEERLFALGDNLFSELSLQPAADGNARQ